MSTWTVDLARALTHEAFFSIRKPTYNPLNVHKNSAIKAVVGVRFKAVSAVVYWL